MNVFLCNTYLKKRFHIDEFPDIQVNEGAVPKAAPHTHKHGEAWLSDKDNHRKYQNKKNAPTQLRRARIPYGKQRFLCFLFTNENNVK